MEPFLIIAGTQICLLNEWIYKLIQLASDFKKGIPSTVVTYNKVLFIALAKYLDLVLGADGAFTIRHIAFQGLSQLHTVS